MPPSRAATRPSEFMRRRRPELFSDSKRERIPEISQAVFEHHLETLTNRKQELQFEYFCRRLAEKELCPNLLPSAKKEWKAKITTDVRKIVATGRNYKLVYFISNQFIPDKKRAKCEDALAKEYAVAVRILDRS